MRIGVTGANGQLGQSFRFATRDFPHNVTFWDKSQLDITDQNAIEEEIRSCDVLVNCAAYTQVDLAESERTKAYRINSDAVAALAKSCARHNVLLVHFSSDYVYHNSLRGPLKETDPTRPKGVYARSKLAGERKILEHCRQFLIFRVSWLYGPYGKNFPKTMMHLAKTRKSFKIVNDQIGAPTNTVDLAHMVLTLVGSEKQLGASEELYGIYNYCNLGVTSWDQIARFVFAKTGFDDVHVDPIPSREYPTAAKRPRNSRMNLDKWSHAWGLDAYHWEASMSRCLSKLIG